MEMVLCVTKKHNTNRAPACFGLGAEVQDFTEAVQQEMGWWPCQPITEWLRDRITTDPQCSSTGTMFDENPRSHETSLDFALTMEIKEWALEQVEKSRFMCSSM